jgi:hypothetical protein
MRTILNYFAPQTTAHTTSSASQLATASSVGDSDCIIIGTNTVSSSATNQAPTKPKTPKTSTTPTIEKPSGPTAAQSNAIILDLRKQTELLKAARDLSEAKVRVWRIVAPAPPECYRVTGSKDGERAKRIR